MIALPFKFAHCSSPEGVVYTAKVVDESSNILVTWPTGFGADGEATYSSLTAQQLVCDGVWIVVEEPKIDFRTALKIRLFEMRIADMEKNLIALKREFELHKQDVKGIH
jgi:hypothetical protein